MTIDQALEQVDRIRPRRTFFTHMAHDIEHAQVEAQLPENIRLSYDGLVVHCE
jgi:phosphoribosyl 1,2-cyclic phosphate phosphodiesterase